MLRVLYEDNHLLAVDKPAGVASAHEPGSVLDIAKQYIKDKYHKPGNVYLGLVHRLDKPVSGVLLLARTSKAAARLSEQFREHTVTKIYHAWAPLLKESSGEMEDWLWHNEPQHRVEVVNAGTQGAQYAKLRYRIIDGYYELTPQTGRKHQLRVQLASRGCPIHGDTKYGSRVKYNGIALIARSLTIQHPTTAEFLSLSSLSTAHSPLPTALSSPDGVHRPVVKSSGQWTVGGGQ